MLHTRGEIHLTRLTIIPILKLNQFTSDTKSIDSGVIFAPKISSLQTRVPQYNKALPH
jgi:hypothetical protein